MGAIISVVNEKGGVGKTTCTYNLAVAMARQGLRVLMIDLDYQCSLTVNCGYKPDLPEFIDYTVEDGKRTPIRHNIINFFKHDENNLIKKSFFTIDSIEEYCRKHPDEPDITDLIYIVPGSIEMAEMENNMFFDHSIRQRFIENLNALKPKFHFILIDCAPHLNLPMTTALIGSQGVVIPVKPEGLDYYGLLGLNNTIDTVREAMNPDLVIIGTILNLFRSNVKTHKEYLQKLQSDDERPLLGIVRESTLVTKGFDEGLPVVLTSQSSQPTKAFNEIAETIMRTQL